MIIIYILKIYIIANHLNMDTFICPICNEAHKTMMRYPTAVCRKCLSNFGTKDVDGNYKNFRNIDIYGGLAANVNGVETRDYTCYVNNIKCYAQEARFGGVVISKYYENNQIPQYNKE